LAFLSIAGVPSVSAVAASEHQSRIVDEKRIGIEDEKRNELVEVPLDQEKGDARKGIDRSTQFPFP